MGESWKPAAQQRWRERRGGRRKVYGLLSRQMMKVVVCRLMVKTLTGQAWCVPLA